MIHLPFSVCCWDEWIGVVCGDAGCVPPLSRPVRRALLPPAPRPHGMESRSPGDGPQQAEALVPCFHGASTLAPHRQDSGQHSTAHPARAKPRVTESSRNECRSQRQRRFPGRNKSLWMAPARGHRARVDSAVCRRRSCRVVLLALTQLRCMLGQSRRNEKRETEPFHANGHRENKRDQVPATSGQPEPLLLVPWLTIRALRHSLRPSQGSQEDGSSAILPRFTF
ncbi:hypothetical protein QBC39DRAFT_109422 [Podospora conica]|nr:hypothetical protein QBC39DRAFT_109422 [Schizothecium conicum]